MIAGAGLTRRVSKDELEATPAAAFPYLGRFGAVDLHVYATGVRADLLWLKGLSTNGAAAHDTTGARRVRRRQSRRHQRHTSSPDLWTGGPDRLLDVDPEDEKDELELGPIYMRAPLLDRVLSASQ